MSAAVPAGVKTSLVERVRDWWFPMMPRGRLAVFRSAVYAFVFLDVFVIRPWVLGHGSVPGELYNPLFIGRILPLPTPTPELARFVQVALLVSAAAGLTGRWPRLAGAATFVFYLEWMFLAFSYGKVDHDRVAFLVALAVIPTAGRVKWGDRTPDQRVGWAIRCVQVAVVLTYFLAAFAKLRFGGIEWLDGSTLMRAVLRRGTFLTDPAVDNPWILHIMQYVIVSFELLSPLLLAPGRLGRAFLVAAVCFHLMTFSAITIMFWPHVLCLLSFLPLERISRPKWLSPQRLRPRFGT